MADKVLDNLLLSQLWQKSVNTFLVRANYLQTIYPIGSIYMSVNSTSPASLFGGTWEQLQNRFLLGAGSSYTAGATGGEAIHTLTIQEMPSHEHRIIVIPPGEGSSYVRAFNSANASGSDNPVFTWSGLANNNVYAQATGGGQAHNNMPPYLVVYMWKRTA